MTVATTQISEVWTGDASSVTFPIPFPFLDRAHLIVWKETSGGIQTAMAIQTATGEGEPSGGSITLTEPVGEGFTLHVRRNTPKTQETDYVPHDPFPADSHERALDKLTMIVQELIASGSIDIDIDHLGDLIGDSPTIVWTRSPDGTKLIGSVVPGAGDTYKVKVNADDATPGFLENKIADTTDTQFSPTEDGSQLDNIVYQLTGLGTRLNRVKDAGFDFEVGPFPQASHAGGRGICFGRRFVAGVEVDTWVAQANNGKLYWTSNNDASRWKVVTEDLSVYTTFPNDRTHYGWSCIQFVYVAGTHNCYCWVMGSGDHERHITFIEHKAENYNADGTFKASALDGVTYPVGTGPYTPIDIMQVDTSGGIFFAGDDPKVGYTTDLANFQLAVTADANVGGLGFDGETTVQVIERDTGVIWRSSTLGSPGSFAKVATFYLDDVPVANFPMPQPGGSAAQWGSMFSMYGQWLAINFHYVAGGIGFIYSDDGIYWYSSRDEATAFYDANNDGLRWFATNAAPNSGTPIFQLIVSVIPVHRRMSLEKGAVISGPTILREIPNAVFLGTDHRGRVVSAAPISMSSLAANPPKFVLVGGSFVISSDDGVNWCGSRNYPIDGVISRIVYVDGVFLILAGLYIYATLDGRTWSVLLTSSAGTNPYQSIARFTSGMYFGNDGYESVAYAENKLTLLNTNPKKYNLAAGRGVYGFRFDPSGYMSSTNNNGVTWSGPFTPGFNGKMIFAGAGRWGVIPVNPGQTVKYTEDTVPTSASSWAAGGAVGDLPNTDNNNYERDGTTIVVPTSTLGVILVSVDDGVNFVSVDTGIGKQLFTVHWAAGLWYLLAVAANTSYLYSSNNLSTWTLVYQVTGSARDFFVWG